MIPPRFRDALERLSYEPPLRLVARFLLKLLPVSAATRSNWDISSRPAYLLGLVVAAEQARNEGREAISVIEFGVAGGRGLVALQDEAAAVERESGVIVKVFGFDMGSKGLPEFIGDYRDHPEKWKPGDFPMHEAALRAKLTPRTTLVLGNVRETVGRFFDEHQPPPIGFVSFDMDLYSSTREALKIFTHPKSQMLLHVPLYFDDMGSFTYHGFAGEMLAVDEFNAANNGVKIDVWAGVRDSRPFPERPYLGHMFVAHDLEGASKVSLARQINTLPLS
jgi:hypothetical protein